MSGETVGQRLLRVRLERGRTQRSLAEPGVSHAYISRIEAGTRRPSVRALRVLAVKLGVTAEYLEFGVDITTTDDLVRDLAERVGMRPITVTARFDGVDVQWHGGRKQFGATLTEALVAAIRREKELSSREAEVKRLQDELATLA